MTPPPPMQDDVAAIDIIAELRKLYRGLEMSAAVMRDPKRTGNWPGAQNTANAFAHYAAKAQSLHAIMSAQAALIARGVGE